MVLLGLWCYRCCFHFNSRNACLVHTHYTEDGILHLDLFPSVNFKIWSISVLACLGTDFLYFLELIMAQYSSNGIAPELSLWVSCIIFPKPSAGTLLGCVLPTFTQIIFLLFFFLSCSLFRTLFWEKLQGFSFGSKGSDTLGSSRLDHYGKTGTVELLLLPEVASPFGYFRTFKSI